MNGQLLALATLSPGKGPGFLLDRKLNGSQSRGETCSVPQFQANPDVSAANSLYPLQRIDTTDQYKLESSRYRRKQFNFSHLDILNIWNLKSTVLRSFNKVVGWLFNDALSMETI
jgi:hypothetical protein